MTCDWVIKRADRLEWYRELPHQQNIEVKDDTTRYHLLKDRIAIEDFASDTVFIQQNYSELFKRWNESSRFGVNDIPGFEKTNSSIILRSAVYHDIGNYKCYVYFSRRTKSTDLDKSSKKLEINCMYSSFKSMH